MRLPVCFLLFLVPVVAIQLLPGAVPVDIAERLEVLESEIARHDQAYYRENSSTISDIEYDALQQQRVALAEDPVPDGIGDDRRPGFEKCPHPSSMLSLKKAHGISGLEDYYDQIIRTLDDPQPVFIVEPKVDGIAINLVYEKGILKMALTRGNGSVGDVITESIQNLDDLPVYLKKLSDGTSHFPDRLEIRGEVHVEKQSFQRINRLLASEGKAGYATPRSLAAGLARSGGDALSSKALRLVVFDWGIWEPESCRPSSYTEFRNLAKTLGFRVLESGIPVSNREDLLKAVEEQLGACRTSPVPCDGVVVKLDDALSRCFLGSTARAPNWAIACKFPAQTASTTIKIIHLQMGRTGCLTPVAELVPVEINRRQISRMNLHSPSFVKAMDVREGDQVIVALSGDVIPVLQKVETESRKDDSVSFAFLSHCPFCQSLMDGTNGGPSLRCPNYGCPERLKRRLEHFAGKLGLSGIGPATLGKLVDCGSVDSYADLLNYYCYELSRPLDLELWQVLAGIGIPNLGPVRARKLALIIGGLENILILEPEKLRSAELSERVVRSIGDYVSHPETGSELRELIDWFDAQSKESIRSPPDSA